MRTVNLKTKTNIDFVANVSHNKILQLPVLAHDPKGPPPSVIHNNKFQRPIKTDSNQLLVIIISLFSTNISH